MSFSFRAAGPADEIRASVKAASPFQLPKCLHEFVLLGINGVKEKHGGDVHVEVLAQGHLNAGDGSYDVSSVEIGVRKATVIAEAGDFLKEGIGAAERFIEGDRAADVDPNTSALPPAQPEPIPTYDITARQTSVPLDANESLIADAGTDEHKTS